MNPFVTLIDHIGPSSVPKFRAYSLYLGVAQKLWDADSDAQAATSGLTAVDQAASALAYWSGSQLVEQSTRRAPHYDNPVLRQLVEDFSTLRSRLARAAQG